jgi:predicted metalloprotease with PDZ domain
MLRSLTLLAAGALLCGPEVLAQSGASSTERTEETIILKRNSDQPQTTIEINDGIVKVNGETVAQFSDPAAKGKRKKIIIDGGDDAMAFGRGRDIYDDREDRTVVRKTVLGVLTESTQALNGARVKRVLDGSAADEADLRVGDRIFRVDNRPIKSSEDLVALIGGHQPGDKVVIAYERDGKNRTATATLKAADPETTVIPNNPFGGGGFGPGDDMEGGMPNGMMRSFPFGNFDFRNMMEDRQQRPKLGMSVEDRQEGDGVRVAEVTEGSAAEKAGIKEGDILTHAEGEPLASVDDLQKHLRIVTPGDKLALRYERSGKQLKTDVTVPKVVRKRDL